MLLDGTRWAGRTAGRPIEEKDDSMTNPQSGDQPAGNPPGEGPVNMPPPPAGEQTPAYGVAYGSGPAPAAPRNGLGVAALVLGIIALVFCWTVIGGVILGILALIFGIIGYLRAKRGEATNAGVALSGAITGGIGLIVSVVLLIVGASILGSILNTPAGKNLTQCIQDANGDQTQIQQCQEQFQQQYMNNDQSGG